MSTFLNSNSIKVYPCARRNASNDINSYGVNISEQKIASSIRDLTSKESYANISITNSTLTINKLIIYGYTFDISQTIDLDTFESGATNCYAYIVLDSNNLLIGNDTDSKFTGLTFTNTLPTPSANQTLKWVLLAKKESGTWKVEHTKYTLPNISTVQESKINETTLNAKDIRVVINDDINHQGNDSKNPQDLQSYLEANSIIDDGVISGN